ncbi:MAG: (d)CMP kinase [Acidimicrobiia bacterium]|nr:(d)CMP kinase [Acidimicrobiia bacterium]
MSVVVAIDGPSGSGKSTVARGVADALGLDVLDTGAMYRAVTQAVLARGADPHDAAACAQIARDVAVDLGERVLLDGVDVTSAIRGPEVTGAVSTVSAHPEVRSVLVDRQRSWVEARHGGVVEGRDIGTVVFSDATVKVFLTASDDERARRRQRDEHDAQREVDVAEVRDDLARRDHLDSSRQSSPLKAAPDAEAMDTTGRSVTEVVDHIVQRVRAATKAD